MRAQILKRQKDGTPELSSLRRKAELVMESLLTGDCELSLLITDDDEIRKLNHDYRGLDKPTDVLSFPQGEGEFSDIEPEMLGDVVISIETARRQARAAGKDLEDEIEWLLVHGILHLIGYDHEKSDGEEDRMRKKEGELLAMLATHKREGK